MSKFEHLRYQSPEECANGEGLRYLWDGGFQHPPRPEEATMTKEQVEAIVKPQLAAAYEPIRERRQALLAQRGNLYRMPTPDIPEMLRLNQRDPTRTYVIDVRPCEDACLQLTWRSQYRYVGPRCRLDLDWLRLMGYSLIVLGDYVEGTIEEERTA